MSSTSSPKTIVAGYDGSPDSASAVRWAAAEARARDAVLVVCTAWDLALSGNSSASKHSAELLRRGLGQASTLLDQGRVEAVVIHGSPVRALLEAGATAQMIVVGSRGTGGLPGLLLGSVPVQLAAHCPVPLVVVRAHARLANAAGGPVLIGVDGSAGSAAAAAFGFRLANLHALPVAAVCALADAPGSLAGSRRVEEDFCALMDRMEKEYPSVLVQRDVLPGAPRPALLRLAAQARAGVLVVGARGRGGFTGMTLGSVAQAMLHHARCPVAVVPSGVPLGVPAGQPVSG